MKKVLLAIDGEIPTNSIFNYSVGLCRRISAELNILQFIEEVHLKNYLSKTKSRMERLGKFLEDSFAGAGCAEEGAFFMADEFLSGASIPLKKLIRAGQSGVVSQVALASGTLETQLPLYVENHQDIVLTVFDPSRDQEISPKSSHARATQIRQIKKRLCVPLVTLGLTQK